MPILSPDDDSSPTAPAPAPSSSSSVPPQQPLRSFGRPRVVIDGLDLGHVDLADLSDVVERHNSYRPPAVRLSLPTATIHPSPQPPMRPSSHSMTHPPRRRRMRPSPSPMMRPSFPHLRERSTAAMQMPQPLFQPRFRAWPTTPMPMSRPSIRPRYLIQGDEVGDPRLDRELRSELFMAYEEAYPLWWAWRPAPLSLFSFPLCSCSTWPAPWPAPRPAPRPEPSSSGMTLEEEDKFVQQFFVDNNGSSSEGEEDASKAKDNKQSSFNPPEGEGKDLASDNKPSSSSNPPQGEEKDLASDNNQSSVSNSPGKGKGLASADLEEDNKQSSVYSSPKKRKGFAREDLAEDNKKSPASKSTRGEVMKAGSPASRPIVIS